MKEYRIYTEDKPNVPNLVSCWFPGFTMYYTRGYWQGRAEYSIVVEILARDEEAEYVQALANHIRKINAQTCVIVTEKEVTMTNLITPPKEG